MKKINTALRYFFIFVSSLPASGMAEEAAPLALVYRGPKAGCPGCAEAIADVLKSTKHGFEVKFVGPKEELPLSLATLRTAALYAQPGGDGDAASASAQLEEELGGKDVLMSWVRDGGRYYGTCLGGYVAGKPEWPANAPADTAGWGFGLLPGIADQWIGSPKASVKSLKEAVVEVIWGGESRWIYFQDGPHFELASHENAQVLATYESNGLPAAVIAPLGEGKVGVVGPHPEANHFWFQRARLEDPTDPDGTNGHALDLAKQLVDQLMEE